MRILFITMVFFMGALSFAQDTEDKDLKIGVVLSGGGAKGLAHIGALKVIEEAGVKVDYIGGTSMGAIVGALYASGYNARQLDSIFRELDFDTLIQDEVPRGAKTFYEKSDAETYALTLPFDDFKLTIPSAISKGQNVYNLLSKLLIHVKDVDDFNDLPIPFFCVATNIETGEEVILDKGYLPRAVTASGALPSLFSPVVIDDTIYVDGGVVNNYPVDEVRAMGADIIIGIDVQDGLRNRKELRSAVDVMVQINNYRTINDMVEKRKKTDIYIHPEIADFSLVSFEEGLEIVNEGELAAVALFSDLKDAASKQKPRTKTKINFNTKKSIYINDVGIDGIDNYTRSYVLGKLKLKIPSEVTYQEFNQGVNNLSATGNYAGIDYEFIEDSDNSEEYSVQFKLKESDSKTLLRLAVHYDDLYRTGALMNITRKRLFTNNDVASLDLVVGDNLRYNFDYYIDKGFYWSVGFNSSYNTFNQNVATSFVLGDDDVMQQQQINQLDLEYDDFTNQVFVQTVFRRSFLLRLGAEHKWLRLLSNTIGVDENNLPRTIFENTNYFSSYGVLKYDTFDNKFFPKEGVYFEGNFNWYLFDDGRGDTFDPFSIVKANFSYAYSPATNFSLVFSTSGGFRIGDRGTNALDFFVGGYGYKPLNNIVPFYGYDALSLRGDTYLSSLVTLDYELFKNNHINVSGNIANVGDKLFERGEWFNGIDYSGIAVGYGLETFFGPIELKYSYSPERKKDEWHVNVGFRF